MLFMVIRQQGPEYKLAPNFSRFIFKYFKTVHNFSSTGQAQKIFVKVFGRNKMLGSSTGMNTFVMQCLCLLICQLKVKGLKLDLERTIWFFNFLINNQQQKKLFEV